VFPKVASAPTKLGEFLGCGVPCLGNADVGDMGVILEEEKVGVALTAFNDKSMREAVERMLELAATQGIGPRCRAVAERRFSLNGGAQAYDRVYRELISGGGPAASS